MIRAYVPNAGDPVWLTFDPQAGREQAGRRPAIVVSPRDYNAKTGLAGYPFEVVIPSGLGITGVVLADHLKSIDWAARKATHIGICPENVIASLRSKLRPLLGY